jgi:hypothetical protein
MRTCSLVLVVFALGQTVLAQESSYRMEVIHDQPLLYLSMDVEASSGNQVADLVGEHHGEIAGELAPCDGVSGIGGQAAMFDGRQPRRS